MVFPAEFALSSLNGENGFIFNGRDNQNKSGWSVSGAGDVNGDGLDDLIVGAPGALLRDKGRSYVIFGTKALFGKYVVPNDLDGTNGFILNGKNSSNFGGYVSGAGDINGDDTDDLIIGAFAAETSDDSGGADKGDSYVVFGKDVNIEEDYFTDILHELNINNLNSTTGQRIPGEDQHDWLGWSVSGAGDINNDGTDDLIVGIPGYDQNNEGNESNEGAAFVAFGGSNFSTTDEFNGFLFVGDSSDDLVTGSSGGFNEEFGYGAVSGVGDINGDGIDDLIIGAPFADPLGRDNAGESYVVFGSGDEDDFSSSLDPGELNGSNGFVIRGKDGGDRSGFSVSGVGDINNDGINDLIIGAPYANNSTGKSYVVFGKDVENEGEFNEVLELSSLEESSKGFIINGIGADDFLGWSVSGAGDVNDDGIDDLIIGAPGADLPDKDNAGESYVIFGSNSDFNNNLDISTLNNNKGFVINGIKENDWSGWSVSGAGDINGDAIADLIIGAPFAEPVTIDGNDRDAGESYVVFGQPAQQGQPTLSITPTDAEKEEGDSGTTAYTFTLTRAENTTGETSVTYEVTGSGNNPANANDFVGGTFPSDTVTFADGETEKEITVEVTGDSQVELDENFTLTLTDPSGGAQIINGTATGTILNDDDVQPTLSITPTDGEKEEGDSGTTAYTFTVTRAENTTGETSVTYEVTGSGNNPANADDFVGGTFPSGTVTFADGETEKEITVEVTGDSLVEPDENFTLNLTDPSGGAQIINGTATGTILNDDTENTPPQNFYFSTDANTYTPGETLSLTNAWVLDHDGTSDIEEVDMWLLPPDGSWQDVEDAEQFQPWSQGDEWASFDEYTLDLDGLESGEYTLWGKAYDSAGNTSDAYTTTFQVSNTAPQDFYFSTDAQNYSAGETLSLSNAWVLDPDGTSDIEEVDMWLLPPDGNWQNVQDATEFEAWSGGNEWASFNEYTLNLRGLDSGEYTLWGKAYDSAGNVSDAYTTTFEVTNTAPQDFYFSTNAQSYGAGETLSLTNAWVLDPNGTSEIDKVDMWLLSPDGSWQDIEDAEEFEAWSQGDEWASFDEYTLDLDGLESGEYTLWGKAYDSAGNASDAYTTTFEVSSVSNVSQSPQTQRNQTLSQVQQESSSTSSGDELTGMAANDSLVTQTDADKLTKGDSNDPFVYTSLSESGDVITDFQVADDQIVLTEVLESVDYQGSDALADSYVRLVQGSSATQVQIDPDGLQGQQTFSTFITLEDVSAAELSASNFVF